MARWATPEMATFPASTQCGDNVAPPHIAIYSKANEGIKLHVNHALTDELLLSQFPTNTQISRRVPLPPLTPHDLITPNQNRNGNDHYESAELYRTLPSSG